MSGFAVLLAGDLGEAEETEEEEEAGYPERHAVPSCPSGAAVALPSHGRLDTGWSQEWLSQKTSR